MATKKKVKVELTTPAIDFSNSVEKIKTTAKTVNTEVVDTAFEVLEDLKVNGAKLRATATTTISQVIENATLENGVKFVKNTAETINDYSVETAEEIVEEVVKGSKEWQALVAKALKNGVNIYGQQQEIVFDALEILKGQYNSGTFRLRNLLQFPSFKRETSVEVPTTKVTTKVKAAKTATKVAKKAAKPAAKKATAKVKAVAKKVTVKATKPTAKKVTAKVVKPVAKKATAKKAVITKNNLKVIEGIGPKIEALLNKGGIYTFKQLASATQGTLKGILAAGGSRYKMHNPATWNQQAKLAAAGKRAELAKLQEELKGGRAK